jgi:hypothetical protein
MASNERMVIQMLKRNLSKSKIRDIVQENTFFSFALYRCTLRRSNETYWIQFRYHGREVECVVSQFLEHVVIRAYVWNEDHNRWDDVGMVHVDPSYLVENRMVS